MKPVRINLSFDPQDTTAPWSWSLPDYDIDAEHRQAGSPTEAVISALFAISKINAREANEFYRKHEESLSLANAARDTAISMVPPSTT